MNAKETLIKFEKLEEDIINLMTELIQPLLLNESKLLSHEIKLTKTYINSLTESRNKLLPIINGIKEVLDYEKKAKEDYERMVSEQNNKHASQT